MPSSFNRRDPPPSHLRAGGGETLEPQKEGQGVVWEHARLPFPLESCSGTPPALGTHPGETAAGLGTGLVPGNPLQDGRSRQAWRPQVWEPPSLTAWLQVSCASRRKNRGPGRSRPRSKSHSKTMAEQTTEPGSSELGLAGPLDSPAASGQGTFPRAYSFLPSPQAQPQPQP